MKKKKKNRGNSIFTFNRSDKAQTDRKGRNFACQGLQIIAT